MPGSTSGEGDGLGEEDEDGLGEEDEVAVGGRGEGEGGLHDGDSVV